MPVDTTLIAATLITSLGDLAVNLLMPFMTGTCQSDCCGVHIQHEDRDSVHETPSLPVPPNPAELSE